MKSWMKFFLSLLVQAGVFLLVYKILQWQFVFSFLFSLTFILLFSALIFEGNQNKNMLTVILFIINFFLIFAGFFLLPSKFDYKTRSLLKETQVKLTELKKKYILSYSQKEKNLIYSVWNDLAYSDYKSALDKLEIIKKNDYYLERLHSFAMVKVNRFYKLVEEAKKEIPNFTHFYSFYQKGDLSYFKKLIIYYKNTKSGEYFYNLALKNMELKVNHKILLQSVTKEISAFVHEYEKDYLILHFVIYLYPELKTKYYYKVSEDEKKSIGFDDFKQLNESPKETPNLITFLKNHDGEEFFIFIRKLLEGEGEYPLFAFDMEVISKEGEKMSIPFAKITYDSLVFSGKKGFETLSFPQIYHKIKESLASLRTPIHPRWIMEYRKKYPEVFQNVIKPYWMKFIKLLLCFITLTVLSFFTIRYFKAVFLEKISFVFYFLPVFFIVFLSLIYTNFIIKIFEWLL
ncbi:MAG TPA: hypothetical protein DHW82_04425 [Spirochaetia bacterium]|nr:MAG: hypothetical protein A2Y41_14340 [Spirochaetes bacterium GWB1_36_13]HCL56239.1 hypothetical protein [Spirochaetia bacterium]